MEKLQQWLFEFYLSVERLVCRVSHKKLQISDGEIAYVEGGSGATLLMLHGFGSDKESWHKLIAKVSSYFHIVAPDLPGFGASLKDQNLTYDIDRQVSRLHEFISQKKLTKVVLMGSSYGGYLATVYAKKHPEVVNQICLISPLGVQKAPNSRLFNEICAGEYPLLLPRNSKELVALINKCFTKVPFLPNFALQQMARSASKNNALHFDIFHQTHLMNKNESQTEIQFHYPLENIIKALDFPVHVIWGNKDEILSVDAIHVIHESRGDSLNIDVIPDVGHLPQIECPKLIAELVLKNSLY